MPELTESSPEAERLIEEFVGHWGLMARVWGINSTMGELFALLYITGANGRRTTSETGSGFLAAM